MTKNNKITEYTVAKLIKALERFPQYLPLLVTGYEYGFENITKSKKITLEHKADNPYWSGELGKVKQQNTKNSTESVVLRRVVRNV